MFNRRHRLEVDAVSDDDLDELLDRLNLKHKFYAGEYRCKICGATINSENMRIIIPHKEGVTFICDEPSCMFEFAIED